MSVYYIDRKTGEKTLETVFGDKYLRWIYETKPGALFLETLVKRKLFSSLYGRLQDTSYSRRNIQRFADALNIDMSEALEPDIHGYNNFNDFFARRLRADARPVVQDGNVFVSPADGRVYAWENINPDQMIQVKGIHYTLTSLVGNEELAADYAGGVCIIIRLCPSDYHRLHFPDSGVPSVSIPIKGHYYSVNPIALHKIPKLYCVNKRELTYFNSDHFGQMLLIEVGATCVGTIVQTYEPQKRVEKGAEKGYFKFGGSTMIVILKKDVLTLDHDIVTNTMNDIETRVWMGERLGLSNCKR